MNTFIHSTRPYFRKGFLLLLFAVGLYTLTAASQPQQPWLAPPPVMPERPAHSGLEPANSITSASPNCTSGCSFLPMIGSPGGGFIPRPTGRQAARELYIQEFINNPRPATNWTGNISSCTPGSTNPAMRQAVLNRINYFRTMAGIPKVSKMNDNFNQQDQAAALIMAANQALNHTPPSSWKCYSQTGYDGSSSSNLAMGVHGPDAISLYMDDYGLNMLGHRRWVLYPQTQEMGTGDVNGTSGWQSVTNAMKSWDSHIWETRPATRDDFVAWPPPGYVPFPVVFAYWSFAYPAADFSAATVSLAKQGAPVAITRYSQQNGFGENTLVWSINGMTGSWPRPDADTNYQVSIQNVKINGKSQNYSYTVTVFDPDK